jgi:GNAT superfamily N-acetyltransferase
MVGRVALRYATLPGHDGILMTDIKIRTARPAEADALSALCLRSKAHWGYGEEFMARSRAALTISPEFIATGRVFVAEPEGCAPLGVASVAPLAADGVYDLVHLFIEPSAMLGGVGRRLFEAAANKAKADGARRLVIQSDPHAVGFYRRLGATDAGEAPSDSVPGRMLPMLHLEL